MAVSRNNTLLFGDAAQTKATRGHTHTKKVGKNLRSVLTADPWRIITEIRRDTG